MEDEYQRGYDDGYAEAEEQCEYSGYIYDDGYHAGYYEAEQEFEISYPDRERLAVWDDAFSMIKEMEEDAYWRGEVPDLKLRLHRLLRLMEVE